MAPAALTADGSSFVEERQIAATALRKHFSRGTVVRSSWLHMEKLDIRIQHAMVTTEPITEALMDKSFIFQMDVFASWNSNKSPASKNWFG
jgi:hypothetical protein